MEGSSMTQQDLFDPPETGERLRDQVLKKVGENNENWLEACVKLFCESVGSRFCTFTGEDIRFECSAWVGEPKHPNAWGALINSLVKRKVIEATGEYRSPKDKSSHARKIQVYRRKDLK